MSTSKPLHHRELNRGRLPLVAATEHTRQLLKFYPVFFVVGKVHVQIKANLLKAQGGHEAKERAVKYRNSFITDFSMEDGTFGKNASLYAYARAEMHRLYPYMFFF